jgi:hypothetical protein
MFLDHKHMFLDYKHMFPDFLSKNICLFHVVLVRLKHEDEFVWGADQKEASEKTKEYLTTPVLRAPKLGEEFKMYIAAQERVIGAVLLQEKDEKEFLVAYVSR